MEVQCLQISQDDYSLEEGTLDLDVFHPIGCYQKDEVYLTDKALHLDLVKYRMVVVLEKMYSKLFEDCVEVGHKDVVEPPYH